MAQKFKPYFEVDLSDYVEAPDRADLEIIGEDIIDHIIERTVSGTGIKNGRRFSFPSYTKEYEAIEGKSGAPDLVLSGDMLDDLEVLKVILSRNVVRIGYDAAYVGLGKVEGNSLGTYGKKSPIRGKARPFLGITKTELKGIA